MTDPVFVDITGPNFQIPETIGDGLYQKILPPQVTDFTTGSVGGTGAFDQIMAGLSTQLDLQFKSGRITGNEYTKAYIEMVQLAATTALQWALQADNSYWTNQTAQIAAITARVGLETARYAYQAAAFNVETTLPLQTSLLTSQVAGQLLQNTGQDTSNQAASFNLSTILPLQSAGLTLDNSGKTISNEAATYSLANILPLQAAGLALDNSGKTLNNQTLTYNLSTTLPAQTALLGSQLTGSNTSNQISAFNLGTILPLQSAGMILDNQTKTDAVAISAFQLNSVLPAQVAFTISQKAMVDTQTASAEFQLNNVLPQQVIATHEQAEVQHAQTSSVRLDGVTPIAGLVGQQTALYAQQIVSYKRDAEVKAAKLFSDAWITQKTMDDGLDPPLAYTNDSVNSVLAVIMANNNFGVPST